MAKGDKRLNINNLLPGEKYAIQVRAVDNDSNSTWSQKYHITTIDDGHADRTPVVPSLNSWAVDSAGRYTAEWDAVNKNTDGTDTVVKLYELLLTSDLGEAVVSHYGSSGTSQTRSFDFGVLRSLFGGQVPSSLGAQIRVVNTAGTVSAWSEPPLYASLPIPNPPTNPDAKGSTDAVKVSWGPPTDPIHLFGYRVYMGIDEPGFVPTPSNLVYQGPATNFTYISTSYGFTHSFKIVSYSEPGLESSWVEAEAIPISPYGPDDTPPLKPVLGQPVMDRSVLTAAKVKMTWTITEEAEENQDISGFVIRWREIGDDFWRNAYFDKTARDGIIDVPEPFSDYEFQISAYDFVANYSDYEGTTVTLIEPTPPPAKITDLSAVPRFDGFRITWEGHPSEPSVNYGGRYQVQTKSGGSFPAEAADPANTVVSYTTGAKSIDITGLPELSTWQFRVRAVDSKQQYGPWSDTVETTLPPFPVVADTDGDAPEHAPTKLVATGGLNYVNLSWDRVSNPDPVWYEVFASTTENFTVYDETTFVGQSSGTSLMVTRLPSGPMERDTPYYFKVRAVDADEAGPVSTPVSTTLTQVVSTDLGINMGGENLYYNSSFDVDSDNNGTANYWVIYNYPNVEPLTAKLVPGRDGVGKAQRLQWLGVSSGNKGVTGGGVRILRPKTEYVLSFYARGNSGSGFQIVNNAPHTMLNRVWLENPEVTQNYQRYIVKFVTPSTLEDVNVHITVVGHTHNGVVGNEAWIEFDDIQIEAGNVASAYKDGTVSIAKLATGRFESADLIVASKGRIVSQTFLGDNSKGYLITDEGITIKDGQIDAKNLISGTSITSDLFVKGHMSVATTGWIESGNYSDGVNPKVPGGPVLPAAGYKLGALGLDIKSGSIDVGVLKGGRITSTEIGIGVGGVLKVSSTGSIQSNDWNEAAKTGWKISSTGITMDKNSVVDVNALKTGTFNTGTLTIGSGGWIQSFNWGKTGPQWILAYDKFTMIDGTITGATVITNQLKSQGFDMVGGVKRYRFSLDSDGYAEFAGAYVYGNVTVGSDPAHLLSSGAFTTTKGWRLYGTGDATFRGVSATNMIVSGTSTIGSATSAGTLRSHSFNSATGWELRSDGSADFNGGLFRIGGPSSGRVQILASTDATPGAQIRFYRPGDDSKFGVVRQRVDPNGEDYLDIRYNAAITLRPSWQNNTGRTLITMGQDVRIAQLLTVGQGIWLNGGGIDVQGGLRVSGETRFMEFRDGTGGVRALAVNNNGTMVYEDGSSKRYKKNIKPLAISKQQVLNLQSVEFDWRADYPVEGHSVGFIAEQAEEVGLGKFVHYTQTEDDPEPVVDGFDYTKFSAALLMVAQEQQKEIDELKSQVSKLLRARS